MANKFMRQWSGMSPDRRRYTLNLPASLVEAEYWDRLYQVLTDFDFIATKIAMCDVELLIDDYQRVAQRTLAQPKVLTEEQVESLQLLQGALELSAHILETDKTQLTGQMLGRLMAYPIATIQTILQRSVAEQSAQSGVWLSPLTASLTQPGGALVRTLTGHGQAVWAVAIDATGQMALSGAEDNSLKLWDLATGTARYTLSGHTQPIFGVAMTADGDLGVSASEDGTIKVWDLQAGVELHTLQGHTDWVSAIALTSDGQTAISASGDGSLIVWDLVTAQAKFTLTGHTESVLAVAISPDGRWALSGSQTGVLKVWDLDLQTEIQSLDGHTGAIRSVAMMPDRHWGISASADHTLKIWDLATGTVIQTLIGHTSAVRSVAIDQDEKCLGMRI